MSDARSGPGGLDGSGAIAAVGAGETTAAKLYEDAARRIAEWEPELGAVMETIAYQPPEDGPLSGMMVGVKTHFDVAGCRNWFGLQARGMDAQPVDQDATVVARLRDAGATLVCTTAAPFIGMPGGVTPQTSNPRSPDRVSGGSSGGSAAAVAAGLVHAALGSDSGGSIRIPAACCGVVGLQTTRGLVPLTGSGGLTYTMDCVGPLASTVGDARIMLGVMTGLDEEDPYSVVVDSPPRWQEGPLRIGLATELVEWNIDAEVAEAFEAVLRMLGDAGHQVDRVSLPDLRQAMELGPRTIGLVESGSIIEDRFADVITEIPELHAAVERSKSFTGPTLARANHRVAVLRSEVRKLFGIYDLLMTPTLPCRIPSGAAADCEVDIEVGGVTETRTSALTRLVNPWNLAALPAGSLPIGRDSGGAPISLQVIGPQFSDWKILDVMQWIEGALGGPWDTAAPRA
ncbi:MAG TPA: amidase [Acidimicrobiia bacterium]|nr:amidase [Acidimicrobiia bacterium]